MYTRPIGYQTMNALERHVATTGEEVTTFLFKGCEEVGLVGLV